MIFSLTVILLCQLVGEVLVRGTGLPVPGPVLGMALLLAILFVRDRLRAVAAEVDGVLEATGKGLLAHLSLLFVPAGSPPTGSAPRGRFRSTMSPAPLQESPWGSCAGHGHSCPDRAGAAGAVRQAPAPERADMHDSPALLSSRNRANLPFMG
jgi:hypothetical protein